MKGFRHFILSKHELIMSHGPNRGMVKLRNSNAVIILVLILIASGLHLVGSETEPEIKLELIWEGDIPEGVQNVIFLDEKGYNVFSVQCEDSEGALRDKRILMVEGSRLRYYEGEGMELVREVELRGGHVVISKNGRNIVTIEGLERDTMKEGGYIDKPAVLRLCRWDGEELGEGEISPGGWGYIFLYPLGNDKAIAVSKIGNDGTDYQISMFIREGKLLREVFKADGQYPTGVFDYAEDGSAAFFVYTSWDVPRKKRVRYVERVVIDGEGKEIVRYGYRHPGWAGWVSPRGRYLVEVTRGKYLVIRERGGRLIAEHHVQGEGNYYAAFSPDERYLGVTPGPWKVYFFETETGRLLWEYADRSEMTHFSSVAILPSLRLLFAGRSEAVLKPGQFKGSIDELNRRVIENETKDRSIYLLANGHLMRVLGPFPGEGYETQLQAPDLRISKDGKSLLVTTPRKFFIYSIITGKGQ